MNHTYFTLRTGVPSPDRVESFYGPLDVAGMEPKEVEEARAKHADLLKFGPLTNPLIGPIAAIAYLQPDGNVATKTADVNDPEMEADLLRDFWARYDESGGGFAGWNIHAADLQTIKVRSMKHLIRIPARALRPAGAGRAAWIGFSDVRSEFNGAPAKGESDGLAKALGVEKYGGLVDDEFNKVSKFFGLAGRQAGAREFQALWSSESVEDREKALGCLSAELRQVGAIAVAIGLDVAPPDSVASLGLPSPQPIEIENKADLLAQSTLGAFNWDIETGPGELAALKAIMGEFDPSAVKLGNLKDPEKIREKLEKTRAGYDGALSRLSMLDPLLGRICAIGIKYADGRVEIPRATERELIVWFWTVYETNPGTANGWNIFGFDVDWMVKRSWKHGILPPASARTRAGNGYSRFPRFVDLMIEFTGNNRTYLKIDKAAKFFGHEGKNGDGAEFYRLWESEDPADVSTAHSYLTNDVDMSEVITNGLGLTGVEAPPVSLEHVRAIEAFFPTQHPTKAPEHADLDMVV